MKTAITTILLLIAFSLHAQTPYEKAMSQGLELLNTDLQAASQLFERIATAEKENWLPAYYAALANINNSWGKHSKESTLLHMKKAQKFINQAETLSANNPEIMVLQGLLNTCWITYDSSIYGMKLSSPTTALYEKAYAMEPQNPRVVSNRAQWLMGTARFFGKDVKPYCSDLEVAIALFGSETQNGFQPRWGIERTIKAQEVCK